MHVQDWLNDIPPVAVYLMVGLVVGLESLGIPLPGEIVLMTAALMSSQGHANPWLVATSAIIGAVGGDSIACCGDEGVLLLNGEELEEPYLPGGMAPSTTEFDLVVPEGRMFVLGDNRPDSTDSRHLLGAPGGGMIPVERVVGRADRIVWPPPRGSAL